MSLTAANIEAVRLGNRPQVALDLEGSSMGSKPRAVSEYGTDSTIASYAPVLLRLYTL